MSGLYYAVPTYRQLDIHIKDQSYQKLCKANLPFRCLATLGLLMKYSRWRHNTKTASSNESIDNSIWCCLFSILFLIWSATKDLWSVTTLLFILESERKLATSVELNWFTPDSFSLKSLKFVRVRLKWLIICWTRRTKWPRLIDRPPWTSPGSFEE